MRKIFWLFCLSYFFALGILFSPSFGSSNQNELISPLPDSSSLPKKESNQNSTKPQNELPEQITFLLLGLDGRKQDKNPRCDAIHFFVYQRRENKLEIITIPRGTEVFISKTEGVNYLSNLCHLKGVDFTVSQIEKIARIKADYVIKVGFSQTLGILRYLNLPTTPTLQFLRNRNYGIGDYQRSHNQAVFLKDMFVRYLRQWTKLPKPLRFVLFKMVDTNLEFETATKILDSLLENDLDRHPENIILTTKPKASPYLREIHYELKEKNWQNDQEFKAYQKNLSSYLENLIAKAEKSLAKKDSQTAYKLVALPFSQKLWQQIEEEKLRNDFYFRLLKIYLQSTNQTHASSLILDFITEMEIVGNKDYQKKGEELLANVVH